MEEELIPLPTSQQIAFLKEKFGYDNFLENQWVIINSLLNEKRDSFLISASASGKSLCYQYSALCLNGITLVISPSKLLIVDQVAASKSFNIKVCIIEELNNITIDNLSEVVKGDFKIAYTTVEYMTKHSKRILEELKNEINLITFEEVFWITNWRDLREKNHYLGKIRLNNVPILTVSAVASKITERKIITLIGLNNPKIVRATLDRPNIELVVKNQYGDYDKLKELINSYKDKSILIFCTGLKDKQNIKDFHHLKVSLAQSGIESSIYDPDVDNQQSIEAFRQKTTHILLTTYAISMSTNLPTDIRLVIQWGIKPYIRKTLESYCMIIGRAGRDGMPSKSVLYYTVKGLRHDSFRDYMETNKCRRLYIRRYFGEDITKLKPDKTCCDNCLLKLENRRNN